MTRYLIWDFDGTLGYRDGMWSGALLQALDASTFNTERLPTIDDLRCYLRSGFRWHDPSRQYEILSADEWWLELEAVFVKAYIAVGIPDERAKIVANQVRAIYCDPACWSLFDDVIPILTQLSADGWTHLILSNHVPELSMIVEQLGLNSLIEKIFNSAETGFEKPHPKSFATALEYIRYSNQPVEVWMIGDSVEADIKGAAAAGIPAILVRKNDQNVKFSVHDLTGIEEILTKSVNKHNPSNHLR